MQLTNKYHMPTFPLRNVQCLIQWWLVDNWAHDSLLLRSLFSFIMLLEFVWAQSPCPFCGLLTGITMMSTSLGAFIGFGLQKLVTIMRIVGFIVICPLHYLCVFHNLSLHFLAIQVEEEG